MTFATDLSMKLSSHAHFMSCLAALEQHAAIAGLSAAVESSLAPPSEADLAKLLYCAGVFAQADREEFNILAQSIALSALLLNRVPSDEGRSLRILGDIGNFPAVSYARAQRKPSWEFTDWLRFGVSRELNAIEVSGKKIALTDFQKTAWDLLPVSKAIAISAPTSAGKSFLVVEHLCRLALRSASFCAVYVAPTRALLSEIHSKIVDRTNGSSNFRVSTIPTAGEEESKRQIFVLTQERLQVLLAVSNIKFDLIVVDEAQNFSDGARGMILQDCIEQALARSSHTRIVMLAPGAEGFEDIERLVGVQGMTKPSTDIPSVLQNRILVNKVAERRDVVLSLLTARGVSHLGSLVSERGFDHPSNRLAAVALELGKVGGSLVYATGPDDAETVAGQIAEDCATSDDDHLLNLSKFIKSHIHKEYGLASHVLKGVAFHYGKMPTLLREAIEGAFKLGKLRYLVCTTTLFQGVNLPARNVFISTPTRGKGSKLDAAALWNFAGRAGRMTTDIVGNVFLVDYDSWRERPMDSFVRYRIDPAFGRTLRENGNGVLEALSGAMPKVTVREDGAGEIRAAAGLLIARAMRGDVVEFLQRSALGTEPDIIKRFAEAAEGAKQAIQLPAVLLSTNWTVDPFGLQRLFDKMNEKIKKGEIDDLIPVNPHSAGASSKYAQIFMRIQREIYGSSNKYHAVVAGYAVKWMKGIPYPAILSDAVWRKEKDIEAKKAEYEAAVLADPRSRKRAPKQLNVNQVIRHTFDLIEDEVRFRYVQLGKAYVDLLRLSLEKAEMSSRHKDIFDFPLALELGVATQSGWSFMELGLSRIAACALEPKYPNSSLSVREAREWLQGVEVNSLELNPIIVEELKRLRLVA
ncbi:MAG: DEAD/DEAH box helicase [Candidatus Competibacter sp.]|nr:DEAD/DEAH box helicase [Candidatus Competibacter sp.]